MNNLPVLLIGGWAQGADAMQALAQRLSVQHRVNMTSPSELWLRAPESRDRSCYAHGLNSLLKEMGEEIILLGWSMGAIVALQLACNAARQVRRLVLLSATARFCAGTDYPFGVSVRTLGAMAWSLERNPTSTLKSFYEQSDFPIKEDKGAMIRKLELAALMNRVELRQGLDYLNQADLRQSLGRVDTPTLLVHGLGDKIIPWQAGDWLSKHLPGSRICLYNGIGHSLPLHAVDRLAEDIERFLIEGQ